MRFPYKSFCWCLGTTSFRMKNFNQRIEQQLGLLCEFWELPENAGKRWSGNTELQTRYYDFLRLKTFLYGEAKNKAKDAREKTAGMCAIGLIDANRHMTKAGAALLSISRQNDFHADDVLGIPADSMIYLKQLLKTAISVDGKTVRPFIVTVILLAELNGLSWDEYTYFLPLVTDAESLAEIIFSIRAFRDNETGIDEVIMNRLMSMENYRAALVYFLKSVEITEEVITEIGMNRKSSMYDRPYYKLYIFLYEIYVKRSSDMILAAFDSLKQLRGVGKLWKKYLFDTSFRQNVKIAPRKHLRRTRFDDALDEEGFRRTFFAVMHLMKAKEVLQDYADLNRRYMKTTDIILFEDDHVMLDIIPRHYFLPICDDLRRIAFDVSPLLTENCGLNDIAQFLSPDEHIIIEGINREFSLNLASLKEAGVFLEKQRYNRFARLIDARFTDETLLNILSLIAIRNDDEIQGLVTDNADIPTIFEYILGIIWYKISGRRGKILEYMKLSLDADLLPKSHAVGGEADIVYEYDASDVYPAHSVLLEATLTESTNQRRSEMEPVSRHIGNYILRTGKSDSYCIFVANELNVNVISDFRARKRMTYYDASDESKYLDGMKIIPLEIADLKNMINRKFNYRKIYLLFEKAFQSEIEPPHEWRKVCIVSPLGES